ncbi:ATP phosphoribosyltransferase regulatory subunit [Tropicimonas sp. S265A]|uniref:ATP phosphoribosyltransferase regulatory subunit n=1 Tax=Tropicimonas sp. S265A TaxID=3415134 RepID=UPI003C7B2164
MTVTLAHRKVAARLLEALVAGGAQPVEADVLQPAETLLDLYGENIRHRAYVTNDPIKGEQMLRPDFTVPVVQMHMTGGAEPARYAYAGEVFRKQLAGTDRPNEFLQVGYEVFDGTDPAAADAEVFTTIRGLLGTLDLRATIGDIGILQAAVAGLETTERRKVALARHIWRPRRFRALLDRFGGRAPQPSGRAELVAAVETEGADAMIAAAGPVQGVRAATEIAARLEALREDVHAAPIPPAQVQVVEDITRLRETAPNALEHLRDLAVDLPAVGPALDRMEARLEALRAQGVDVSTLEFDGTYGRASLEYYDGFVFGLYAPRRPHMPPLASGGRYDALTAVLGQGRAIPAVGGIIRAGLVADLEGAS